MPIELTTRDILTFHKLDEQNLILTFYLAMALYFFQLDQLFLQNKTKYINK